MVQISAMQSGGKAWLKRENSHPSEANGKEHRLEQARWRPGKGRINSKNKNIKADDQPSYNSPMRRRPGGKAAVGQGIRSSPGILGAQLNLSLGLCAVAQSTMCKFLAPGVVRESSLLVVKGKLRPGDRHIEDSFNRNCILLPHQGLMDLTWQVLEQLPPTPHCKKKAVHTQHIICDNSGGSGCSSRVGRCPSRYPALGQ